MGTLFIFYSEHLCVLCTVNNVHYCEQCTLLWTMCTTVNNVHYCEQCALLCTMYTTVNNLHYYVQCALLCTMRTTVYNVHYCVQCTLLCTMYTLCTMWRGQFTQYKPLPYLRSPSQPTTLLSAHQAALSEVGVIIGHRNRTSDIGHRTSDIGHRTSTSRVYRCLTPSRHHCDPPSPNLSSRWPSTPASLTTSSPAPR